MNNFKKNMVYLQRCSKQAADMLRKQPCLVRTENLDNSLYARKKSASSYVCPSGIASYL